MEIGHKQATLETAVSESEQAIRVSRRPKHDRYVALDAWRGLAALGVVLFHVGIGSRIGLGPTCVFFFFVISGYCIAASAESCRVNQVGLAGYMWRRLRRIYPPYFFSVCYFFLTRFWKLHSGLGDQISRSPVVWVQNLTLTQWLTVVRHPATWPWNNPTPFIAGYWSLNYEEQFYIVVGICLVAAYYCGTSLLPWLAGLVFPALLWNVFHPSIFYGFFLEYWVPFALGSLVFYRVRRLQSDSRRYWIDAGILLLLGFSLFMDYKHSGHIYFQLTIVSSFAVVLLYTSRWDQKFSASWMGRAMRAFGLTSYSLYLTHQCNLRASSIVAHRLMGWGVPAITEIPVRVIFMCAFGAVFWYFCERPFLNGPLPVLKQVSAGAP